jgi:hypothetical protein
MNSFAQKKETILSAKESDPVKMGWMQGFPPPKDKILSAGDGSFFNFPAMRWSVVNMRQLMPTVDVSRGLRAPDPLPYQFNTGDRKENARSHATGPFGKSRRYCRRGALFCITCI